jgi:hypothetical protein
MIPSKFYRDESNISKAFHQAPDNSPEKHKAMAALKEAVVAQEAVVVEVLVAVEAEQTKTYS